MTKTDAVIIKTQEDFLNNNFTSHFIARVRKGCVGFYCERELETKHNWNILTPKLWPSALCLSRSPGLLNRRPRAHSAWWWLFFSASYQHLFWTPIHQGPKPLWLGVAFPTTLVSTGTRTQLPRWTQLSYILVRRSHDLWNRMFNRHQAENQLSWQFRCHSLPVHQSMSVPWEFLARPISSANFCPRDFLSITGHWNVSLPFGASPWNSIFGPGQRSKYYTSSHMEVRPDR